MSFAYNRTLTKINETIRQIEAQLLPSRKTNITNKVVSGQHCTEDMAIKSLHQCIMTITNHIRYSNQEFYSCLDHASNRTDIESCLINIRKNIDKLRDTLVSGEACTANCPVSNISKHSLNCLSKISKGVSHKCLHKIYKVHGKSPYGKKKGHTKSHGINNKYPKNYSKEAKTKE